MPKTNIVVKLQVEGIHNWPEARIKIPQMGFLSSLHRHIFFITAKKVVSHNERDVEIIMFKREIFDYLQRNYFDKDLSCCNFGPRSCETLAQDLLEAYDLQYCEVLEDNENGAEIWK